MSARFRSNAVGNIKTGPATLLSFTLAGNDPEPIFGGDRVVDFDLVAPMAASFQTLALQQVGPAVLQASWLACGRVLCLSNLQPSYALTSFGAYIGASTVSGTFDFSGTYFGTHPLLFTGMETSRVFVPEPGTASLLFALVAAGLTAACTSRRSR